MSDEDRLACPICTHYGALMARDEMTRLYDINGTAVAVGLGRGSRVVAHSIQHTPLKSTPEEFELRQAIVRWLTEPDTPRIDARVLPYLQFGPLRKASSAHTAEHRLYPPVNIISMNGQDVEKVIYEQSGETHHPAVYANLFELTRHYEWPLRVADDYVAAAQRFVGFFYGQNIRSGQMANVAQGKDGVWRDQSVYTEGDWVEPFEIEDDCPFCARMTDRAVDERVAQFQWEIDKEARAKVQMNGGPFSDNFDATPEGREAFHAAIDLKATAFPADWRPFPLIRLPHRLKRTLCIQWNHVVRDWLEEDPRYSYVGGRYFVIWTERLNGFDQRPTRSDTYGSPDSASYYYAMMARGRA